MSGDWVMIEIDERVAKQNGLPRRVPAPKSEFEGLADSGFQLPRLKKWISAFLTAAPSAWRSQNAEEAKAYDRFIAKADFWERGLAALKKQDMAGAISAFKMISNVDPDDHAAKMNLGLAYAEGGDAAAARKTFEAIRSSHAGDVDYHMAVGQTCVTLGDKDAAADEFVLALEAKPDHMDALRALTALGYLVSIYEDPKDATSLTFVRRDAVLESLEEVWGAAPRDAAYYIDQMEYHASEGRHDVALAAAKRAAGAGGDLAERAALGWIAALRELGRIDEASTEAARATAQFAASLALRVERARVFAAGGRGADAKAEIDAVLATDAGFVEALALRFPLGVTLDQESAGQLADLSAFAEAHPSAAGAFMWLGLHQAKAGAEGDAIASLRRAVELAPDDDAIRSAYYTELGRTAKWQELLDDAAKLDMNKRHWTVRWNEAEALSALGKKIEARTAYTAINADEALPIEIRKRAKRAGERVMSGGATPGA